MNTSFYNGLLRFAHVILYFYLAAAVIAVLFLVGHSLITMSPGYSPASTVTIRLDTRRPHELTSFGDAIAGFEAGLRGLPESSPSAYFIHSPYTQQPGGYELRASQYEQLLRYAESNPWKRLLLLQLGFTHDYLSFQFVAFLLASSLLLLLITHNVRRRGAFTEANARYIWWLGLLLIATDAYQVFAYWLVRFVVPPFGATGLAAPLNRYVELNETLDYGGWLTGLFLLIIALIYRRGVELHQEAELTV